MTMLLPSLEVCRAALEAHQQRVHAAAVERRRAANRPWRPSEMDEPTLQETINGVRQVATRQLFQTL